MTNEDCPREGRTNRAGEWLRVASAVALLCLPLLFFFGPRANPALDRVGSIPTRHFSIVSRTALTAFALAILLVVASVISH